MYTVMKEDPTVRVAALQEITELVRGSDLTLISQVEPLVRENDVTLDCGTIERMDAAGIAALITLYGVARETGHAFRVRNLKARVAEILSLVGLDRVLVAEECRSNAHSCAAFVKTAA